MRSNLQRLCMMISVDVGSLTFGQTRVDVRVSAVDKFDLEGKIQVSAFSSVVLYHGGVRAALT